MAVGVLARAQGGALGEGCLINGPQLIHHLEPVRPARHGTIQVTDDQAARAHEVQAACTSQHVAALPAQTVVVLGSGQGRGVPPSLCLGLGPAGHLLLLLLLPRHLGGERPCAQLRCVWARDVVGGWPALALTAEEWHRLHLRVRPGCLLLLLLLCRVHKRLAMPRHPSCGGGKVGRRRCVDLGRVCTTDLVASGGGEPHACEAGRTDVRKNAA
mmetsp:Transcript_19193/g.48804  ORF Transcript_19193/g.48804 Transcript_19193/m.48804 type:complete len:214 (+) Transcript_19193:2556-3197(+)